jgi:galactose mutarotase-like enzyme
VITLQTPAIRVEVDDEHGAVVTAVRDSEGTNALAHYDWETPIPADRGVSYGSEELDFHAGFRGGWQETFPNAGQSAVVEGVPHPFHGEAASSRWEVQERTDTRCVLRVPARSPLMLQRTMTLDPERAVLRIEGVVTNVGAIAANFVWGHHPAFPATAGARIDYPAGARTRPDVERTAGLSLDAVAWPTAPLAAGGTVDLSVVPDERVHRLAYLDGLAEGWAAIRQPAGGVSVGLAWDLAAFPYSWLWLMRDDPGFPFYGRARMLAIEAQTAWPFDGLANARRRNMAHRLQPGESMSSWFTMSLFADTGAAVTGVGQDGAVTFGKDR